MESKNQQTLPDKIISGINLIDEKSKEKIREELIHFVNELINKDFNALIQLLYRIDVNEKRIRHYLNENPEKNSASVLVDLMIERQMEKRESRKKFNKKNDVDDEEKW
ncbi:MAG: hypothetical protein ABI148_04310 [Ginsengibacter sp.]